MKQTTKDSAHAAPTKTTAAGKIPSPVQKAVAKERERLRRVIDNSMACMRQQREDDRQRFAAGVGERYDVLMSGILADALGSEDAGHIGLETIRKLDRWWKIGGTFGDDPDDGHRYWSTVRQALSADCAILGLKTLRCAEAELLFAEIALANRAFAAALGSDFTVSAICANRGPDDYSDPSNSTDDEPVDRLRPRFVREHQREAV